ncbi:MAG: RagB/SusD family nutrient uptake outer membrane protein, partial [Prevotellaceae bacterium]|nr:RagB/SusD family nutrient uptake outer membrane protein [Prevotellaceae bacterium]
RATSTICKALKARLLLYAASPLWNGSFPVTNWKNTHYETPGYGDELVSHTYDPAKWERALTACKEALAVAQDAGYQLFDIATANSIAQRQGVKLPFIPGREADNEANNTFKERVRMFQYIVTAHEGDGNREMIWGQRIDSDVNNGGEATECRLPAVVIQRSNGIKAGGWSALAPTLYTVQHFYTEDGYIPEKDTKFYPQSEWYTRFYEGTASPPLATGMDSEDIKNDIIKLHARREARFYAWIVYDGSQYSATINDGNPLWINFKNTNTNGWNVNNIRNCAGTGYLSKKFVDPNIFFGKDGTRRHSASRRPYIRMAELYLNLAECYAALNNTGEALKNLNIIRQRAGIKELNENDLSVMSLTDWVRNERYVELFEEGHRYYDLRRWCIAPDRLKAGTRYGLNGMGANPDFETFNTPTLIDQPFRWDQRLYLLPIWSRSGMDELYSNPQLVQAPGY